jgi:hypothetical protein
MSPESPYRDDLRRKTGLFAAKTVIFGFPTPSGKKNVACDASKVENRLIDGTILAGQRVGRGARSSVTI